MFPPEDPLAPRGDVFAEPWHAQVLANAHALIRAGQISASEWAEALGAALARAEEEGAADTDETYYLAALEALETVGPLDQATLSDRKSEWEAAYRRTAHGKPVVLDG